MFKEVLAEEEGVTLTMMHDENAESPRGWDCFGKMVCWHRSYNLGDKHEFKTPEDFQEWWKENGKSGELLPLYLYDHSEITMRTGSFSDPWDSGQIGWIYATAETIRKEYSKRITKAVREKVRKLLNAEVETYDMFLTGDVWGYTIKDEDGNRLDSCWGFYGRKYAEEEALSMLKYHQINEREVL